MVRKALCIAFLNVLSLAGCGFGEQIVSGGFKGINSNEASLIIGPEWAQSAENVDVTPGGKSVKKRPGFGLYKSAFSPSIGIHGGYHFFNSNGEDVQVWGSSVSVKGIVADGTPTTIVSSMTVGATLDCADTQGSAYCVSSSRDFYIKTNGTTLTNWYTSPLGTMVETTVDRIAVAGVSATPNTIYHSGSNAFTTYTVGPLTTDPFTEVIASPGSKLTHLRWGCGKLLWWKDQSFGYEAFDDQYSLQIKIISDNIGTFDNTSAIDPGGSVWFRGQEGHIYRYDCSALTKESIEISPFIQSSGRRSTNLLTQTSQADWQAGAVNPQVTLSTAISVGDIVTSSFSKTENSSSSGWGSGTASNTTVGTSSISLSFSNANVTNNSFETGSISNWTLANGSQQGVVITGENCTINPRTGSKVLQFPSASCSDGYTFTVQLKTCSAGTVLNSTTFLQANNSCTWTARTLSSSGAAGKSVKIHFENTCNSETADSDCFVNSGTNITFYTASDITRTSAPALRSAAVDDVTDGSSTITSGTFTSQALNTGMPYSYVYSSATWSVNTTTPSFVLQKSADGSTGWLDVSVGTNTNSQVNQKYIRYLSTFTIGSADNAMSAITGVKLIARSSGTYFSAWKSAPNLRGWSSFNPTFSDGDGLHAFYVRASTSPQSVLNSTVAWVSQTANAQIVTSTGIGAGVYFQIIDSFTITSATGTTPTLYDFTVNWYEGNASDQAYMLYFDNSIWASVSYGLGVSSNTYIFKRDLINDGWVTYSFGAGGMLIQANSLYFGSVGTGDIFKFGSGTSDNGTDISAYWRTKTFSGSDPFLENSFTQLDSYWARNANQTATVSYTLNGSTSPVSYSVGLSSTTESLIRSKKALPTGTNGSTIDLKFSDNSDSSAWELFYWRMMFTPYPWKPG